MFFPRKVAIAKPAGLGPALVRELARQVRIRLRIASHSDVARAFHGLGGKVSLECVYERDDSRSDEFAAFAKGDYLVALSSSMRTDEMAIRTFDTAKAIGHVVMHAVMPDEGDGTAIVVPRQNGAKEGDLRTLHDEARWFAWEVIAPRDELDAYVASLGTTGDVAAWEVMHRFGLCARSAQILTRSSTERLRALAEPA